MSDSSMKLIQAMKKIKDLQIKFDDLKTKVNKYAVDLDYETPVYGSEQKKQVATWVQSAGDILKEILDLRVRIQKTNLATQVTIELGGKQVTKSIAEWIHRRRDLAKLEMDLWQQLNDRGLREGTIGTSSGEKKDVKIRRYYDPSERDQKLELFRSEPSTIDASLEIVNATTDLL